MHKKLSTVQIFLNNLISRATVILIIKGHSLRHEINVNNGNTSILSN